jgi:hypothetical protein
MGFNFGSFLAGAAENVVDTLKKDEEDAAKAATFGVKALKENYDKVMAENRKLETEVSENIKALRTFDPTATDAQLFAAATNKTYMAMAIDAAKTNPSSFKVADVVKIKEDNASPLTATELLKAYTSIPAVSQAARRAEGTAVAPDQEASFFTRLRKGAADRAASKAEEQTAKAMGVSIETLRSASEFKRPDAGAGVEFDMSKFQKAKGWDEQFNDAKLAVFKAEKEGDAEALKLARADLLIINSIKESLTPEQQQFANKVADIKNRYMFGTPEERKAAKPDYDKLMADMRAEALAKKVTKDGEGEGKIPALGTLNTFTSAAVARAVAAKHGNLINSKQLAIVEKADGSVGIDYIGDNIETRRQILETQSTAAKNALSLYTDAKGLPLNRDVASVMNSYTAIVPSVVRTDGAAPAAGPQPAAPAPTARPTPTTSIPSPKTREEYDAIPRGTRYIDTDGKTKIKG